MGKKMSSTSRKWLTQLQTLAKEWEIPTEDHLEATRAHSDKWADGPSTAWQEGLAGKERVSGHGMRWKRTE
jgi:hypothetical protein